MNERFEELKIRAVREDDTSHIDFDNLSHTDIQILGDIAVERKFSELIVRECAELLIENGDKQFNIRTVEPESHNKTTDWMEGYEEAVKHYGSFLLKKNAKLIKKHFGVEE